eukprot:NODE_426_length_7665_cov_0.708961.p6 type:complete len:172 gc:universal NODE_426_length_7665_cov_0.708961:6884-6369(-)
MIFNSLLFAKELIQLGQIHDYCIETDPDYAHQHNTIVNINHVGRGLCDIATIMTDVRVTIPDNVIHSINQLTEMKSEYPLIKIHEKCLQSVDIEDESSQFIKLCERITDMADERLDFLYFLVSLEYNTWKKLQYYHENDYENEKINHILNNMDQYINKRRVAHSNTNSRKW